MHFPKSINRCALAAAAAVCAFALPVASRANDLQQFTFLGSSAWSSSAVVMDMYGIGGVWAGRYKANLGSSSGVNIFCTDFQHEISGNQTYSTLAMLGKVTDPSIHPAIRVPQNTGQFFYAAPTAGGYQGGGLQSALTADDYRPQNLGTLLNASQRASAVAWLADQYLTSNTLTKQQLGGVQLAIWDITQDGGNGLGTGSVMAIASSQNADGLAAMNDAAGYILAAKQHLTYMASHADWIQSGSAGLGGDQLSRGAHSQDFVYAAPAPEPMSMVLVGLGLSSVAGLRKKRRVA